MWHNKNKSLQVSLLKPCKLVTILIFFPQVYHKISEVLENVRGQCDRQRKSTQVDSGLGRLLRRGRIDPAGEVDYNTDNYQEGREPTTSPWVHTWYVTVTHKYSITQRSHVPVTARDAHPDKIL